MNIDPQQINNPHTLNKSKSNHKLCNKHTNDLSTANLSTVRSSTQIKRSKSAHAQVQKGHSHIESVNGNMYGYISGDEMMQYNDPNKSIEKSATEKDNNMFI